MSDETATPEANPGANADASYQMAFDSLGPPGSTLLYEHVQLALQRSLSTLVTEMKKKLYHLVKRRSLVSRFQICIEEKSLPTNLAMILKPHNFPATIDEGIIARYNHSEQTAWANFKSSIFIQRAEIIVADLASLEQSFALYADTSYLQERFLKLAPAIRPHPNVMHGLVLSFSVIYAEVISRPDSSKKKRSLSSSNTSVATSCAASDDARLRALRLLLRGSLSNSRSTS